MFRPVWKPVTVPVRRSVTPAENFGILVDSIPSSDDIRWILLRESSINSVFDSLEHVSLFESAGLRAAFKAAMKNSTLAAGKRS